MQKLCRLTTTVYRRKTNNDICLNWNPFAPVSWKRGTLRALVQRARPFNRNLFKGRTSHLEKFFIEKNKYPKYDIKQVFTQVNEEQKTRNYSNNMENSIAVPITLENENEKRHYHSIPR